MNPFEAKSANAFVQHLSVRLIGNGYCFYVQGEIPDHKDPEKVDQKFVERYGVGVSKWVQFRRKERGEAKVRYLRFKQHFILVATEAAAVQNHPFFVSERALIKDARLAAFECFGYSIRCRQDRLGQYHPSVRLSFGRFVAFRMAVMANPFLESSEIVARIQSERLLWFSGVKRQVFRTLSILNDVRRKSGLETVFLPGETVANYSLTVFWK